jgi:hypothetical protein
MSPASRQPKSGAIGLDVTARTDHANTAREDKHIQQYANRSQVHPEHPRLGVI